MKVIRDRLTLHSAPERGMTLIEVVVAMFIFGLVAMGLIYTMTAVLSVTRDSRVRQVAANLAAEEVDLARDIEDVANYGGGVREVTLNGDTFTVTRTSSWVTNPTSTLPSCGTTGGTLRYKQIRVEVTWGGMRGDTGVVSDTLINPNERVTHPDYGTIMVTVQNSVPKGFGGVTVTARDQSSGAVITTGVTDSNGCAYLLMVPPGYYDLTIEGPSHEEFISAGTGGTPAEVTSSVAGEVSSALFEVYLAASLDVDYVHDGNPVTSEQLPTNLATSIITTGTAISERNSNPAFPSISVVPETSTTLVAGDIRNCLTADPQSWAEAPDRFAGERIAAVAAESGETLNVDVPVRLVEVKNIEDLQVRAISRNQGSGCATPMTLDFAAVDDENRLIALPYGYWDLQKRVSTGWWGGWTYQSIGGGDINVFGNDSKSGSTVVLDPRVPKP